MSGKTENSNRFTPKCVVYEYIRDLLIRHPDFTGSIELNFKEGAIMDIQEIRRTKIDQRNHKE